MSAPLLELKIDIEQFKKLQQRDQLAYIIANSFDITTRQQMLVENLEETQEKFSEFLRQLEVKHEAERQARAKADKEEREKRENAHRELINKIADKFMEATQRMTDFFKHERSDRVDERLQNEISVRTGLYTSVLVMIASGVPTIVILGSSAPIVGGILSVGGLSFTVSSGLGKVCWRGIKKVFNFCCPKPPADVASPHHKIELVPLLSSTPESALLAQGEKKLEQDQASSAAASHPSKASAALDVKNHGLLTSRSVGEKEKDKILEQQTGKLDEKKSEKEVNSTATETEKDITNIEKQSRALKEVRINLIPELSLPGQVITNVKEQEKEKNKGKDGTKEEYVDGIPTVSSSTDGRSVSAVTTMSEVSSPAPIIISQSKRKTSMSTASHTSASTTRTVQPVRHNGNVKSGHGTSKVGAHSTEKRLRVKIVQ